MTKPKIFLSHITEEADLASAFKKQIEDSFLGLVEVFQSSDPRSLKIGENWFNNITDALRSCEAILVFCSPYSIRRPWINFECGAGWSRNIEVVPICHSGLRPVDLPVPLSLLQGVDATNPTVLTHVFEMIAGKLMANVPSVNTRELAENVVDFSENYIEKTEIHSRLLEIHSSSSELLRTFSELPASKVVPITGVPEKLVERCRLPLEALQKRGVLSFNYSVNGLGFAAPGGNGGGNFGDLTIKIEPKLVTAIKLVLAQVA